MEKIIFKIHLWAYFTTQHYVDFITILGRYGFSQTELSQYKFVNIKFVTFLHQNSHNLNFFMLLHQNLCGYFWLKA